MKKRLIANSDLDFSADIAFHEPELDGVVNKTLVLKKILADRRYRKQAQKEWIALVREELTSSLLEETRLRETLGILMRLQGVSVSSSSGRKVLSKLIRAIPRTKLKYRTKKSRAA